MTEGVPRVDDFNRSRSPSGRRAMMQATARSDCGTGAQACAITRGPLGNSWCLQCGDIWSVTHTDIVVLVARSHFPIGIDAEVPRRRPAAFRFLTRATGARIETIEQWTQAEALWKASGQAHRRPLLGELAMPTGWTNGWHTTTDSRWSVYTQRETGLVWSCAIHSSEDDDTLDVIDLRE